MRSVLLVAAVTLLSACGGDPPSNGPGAAADPAPADPAPADPAPADPAPADPAPADPAPAASAAASPPAGSAPGASRTAVPGPDWARVSEVQRAEARRLGVPVAFENGIGMRFVLIPAGSFPMGADASEAGAEDDERPAHRVTLTKAFYVAIHETTNDQWLRFVPSLPSIDRYAGVGRPVNYVSHVSATRFVAWLNRKEPGRGYALPTEAQWEHACRAGTTTPYATGETLTREQANVGAGRDGTTRPVASHAPNAWGLYDVHGNVLEWCADWFGRYAAAEATDPVGPATGTERVLRGGSWQHEAKWVRSASRHRSIPNDEYHAAGFRLVAASAP